MTKIATVGDVVTKAISKNWSEGDITGQLSTDKTNCPTYFQLRVLRLGGSSSGRALTINGTYENNQLVKNSDISVPDAITYVQKTIKITFNAAADELSNIFTEQNIFDFKYYVDDKLQKSINLPDQTLYPGDNVTDDINVNIPETYISGVHKLEISYVGNETFATNDAWVNHNINDGDVSYNGSSATVIWYTFSSDSVQIYINAIKEF